MADDLRAARIIARSLVRELLRRGFEPHDVVALAAELIGEAANGRAAKRDRER